MSPSPAPPPVVPSLAGGDAAACVNCGAPVVGPFCPGCGQEHAQARVLSVREFVVESLDTFVSFDSKVFRTLVPLLTRPGALTRAYLEGRRAPYLSPMKLFVVLNVAYFFLAQRFSPLTAEAALGAEDLAARAAARGLTAAAFSARFENALADIEPTFVFVLVPLFAVGVAALHVRSRRPFALHLVFAFHALSFVLVAFAAVGVADSESEALAGAAIAALTVYFVVAIRRVYGRPWGRSVAKGVLATGWFLVLLFLYYAAVIGAALEEIAAQP